MGSRVFEREIKCLVLAGVHVGLEGRMVLSDLRLPSKMHFPENWRGHGEHGEACPSNPPSPHPTPLAVAVCCFGGSPASSEAAEGTGGECWQTVIADIADMTRVSDTAVRIACAAVAGVALSGEEEEESPAPLLVRFLDGRVATMFFGR